MKKHAGLWVRGLVAGAMALFALVAQAAVSVSITPTGEVTTNNVRVVVTVNSTTPGTPTFTVKVDGLDVSSYFNQGAVISTSGTVTTAKVEYLFGGGTKTVNATVSIPGESPVSASTTFTVPGDLQEVRKNNVMSKVNQFLHQWDAYDFHRWSSAGNYTTFVNRIWEPAMQVYVVGPAKPLEPA